MKTPGKLTAIFCAMLMITQPLASFAADMSDPPVDEMVFADTAFDGFDEELTENDRTEEELSGEEILPGFDESDTALIEDQDSSEELFSVFEDSGSEEMTEPETDMKAEPFEEETEEAGPFEEETEEAGLFEEETEEAEPIEEETVDAELIEEEADEEGILNETGDQAVYIPKGPELVSGGTTDGVILSWHLTEDPMFPDFPEGYADGAGVIDHFNVYRNGLLAAQVDQNACRLSPFENKYEWEIVIPCDELSGQNQQISYSWWVTAVATQELGGAEGYDSNHGIGTPDNTRPIIESYEAYWDSADSVVTLRANEDYNMTVLKVWRDGVYLGDSNHNPGNEGYFNNGIEYYDYSAMPGHIFTYQLASANSSGVESERVTFTVNTTGDDWWISSPYIRYDYNWRIVNGQTVRMDDVYFDPDCRYTIYRNGAVSAIYEEGGNAYEPVVYTDTPSEYGTYVYQVMKEERGVRTYSQKFTFIKEPQGEELSVKPEAPRLTARIVGEMNYKKVKLSWTGPSVGAEPEGYFIYRTDAGVPNTDLWDYGDWQEEYRMTHYGRNEPAQGRFYKCSVSDHTFTDTNISWWDENEYPHQYWVCAYNAFGISEPSNIITYEYEDSDDNGYPDEPSNTDDEAPGEPVITGVTLSYSAERVSPDRCDFYVTWEKSPAGGEVDHYKVCYDRLLDNGEYETDTYWDDVYPGMSNNEELKAHNLYYFPGEYGSYRVRVIAENSKGTAAASREFYLGGIPSLRVKAAETPAGSQGASAALTWTTPYQDDVTVTGYEIWRGTAHSLWEKTAEFGPETLTCTDSGLSDRETYIYKVIAVTADPNLPKRVSVERSVTVYDGYSAPCTPVLHELQLGGISLGPDLLLSWDMPSGGVPTGYYLQTKKTTGDEEGQWKDWGWWDNSDHAWIGGWDEDREKEEHDLQKAIPYADWCGRNPTHDTYSVRLRAKNSCGFSEWSEPVSVTNVQALRDSYTEPQQPACYVTPTVTAGDASATLNWLKTSTTGFEDAAYYEIYRYLVHIWQGTTVYDWQTTYTSYDDEKLIATIPASKTSYSFTDRDLDNGTLYGYEVRACSVSKRYYNSRSSYGYYNSNAPYPGFVMVTPGGKTPLQLLAEQFAAMIAALPDPAVFDPADEEQLDAVNQVASIYDALTDEQKQALAAADKEKLAALRGKIQEAEDASTVLSWQERISAVQALMDALPDADSIDISILDDKEALKDLTDRMAAAEAALNRLPEAAANEVDRSRLTALENRLFHFRQTIADQAAVDRVITNLNELPAPDEVNMNNAEAVQAQVRRARMSYQALLPKQKNMLSADPAGSAALANLEAVETKLGRLLTRPMELTGTTSYTRMVSAGGFSLSVRSSAPGALFTYSSSNAGVAFVDTAGNVTPVSSGTAMITVTAAREGYFTTAMTVTVKVTGLAVGKSGTFGTGAAKASYKVTGADTVMYVKCKASKKSKTLTVPDTVTVNGGVYRVTAVGGSAFSGFKKVKKLTVGSNVTSIGAKAFNKCKKLKTLTVRSSKLTAAGCKKALKGSSVRTVKVPKAAKKTYKKKVFVKKICGRKVSVK